MKIMATRNVKKGVLPISLILEHPFRYKTIRTMNQRVIVSQKINTALAIAISECEHDKIFVLADTITHDKCWPKIESLFSLKGARRIIVEPTDSHKDINSLTHVWQALQRGGATRHSCLLNLGGGMVTDLGGLAASTFKRGINFINIPTTLLAMVDASVGGKTGINFGGLKNEIGVFSDAEYVIIDTDFLKTLDTTNLRSGYAEMLKHGLISNKKHWAELINFHLATPDLDHLQRILADSIKVKERVVTQDPQEKGPRQALNFGHTFGHAFESFSFRSVNNGGEPPARTARNDQAKSEYAPSRAQPLPHGYAVAFGLVCELYLSAVKTGFPTDTMRQTVRFIRHHYGQLDITCDDYPELIELMAHDKKNKGGVINFTLLGGIGDIRINQTASDDEIKEALDFLREG